MTEPSDGGLAVRLRQRDPEAGTGLIGTSAGVAAFLLLVLTATQLAINLYATSTVSAAGWDSARAVASSEVDHDDPRALARAQSAAEARFHDLVGEAADGARFTWWLDGGAVHLRVQVDPPGLVSGRLGLEVGFDSIDRTFVVRLEAVA